MVSLFALFAVGAISLPLLADHALDFLFPTVPLFAKELRR